MSSQGILRSSIFREPGERPGPTGRSLATLYVLLLISSGVWCQTPTGAIEGAVSDSSGAAVPRARVTVSELATDRTIPLTTNEFGRYSLPNLLPGLYQIQVAAPGFYTQVIDNVRVSSGAVVNGDVALQLGRAEQVVRVTAEAVTVDTSRQTVDTIVTETEIKNMPLFSRNFLDLAALAPGTIVREGGDLDPTKTRAYRAVSVSGRSGMGTRVQIDGIDVTDEVAGTTTANISPEAVSEFQLTRSSLDISASLTSSGAVNIISRSGSNQIHGRWFWDYYNQDMGARLDYNRNAEPFKRNRTGGSAGGRFLKDRLFWFANWERHYQTEQLIYTAPEFPQLNVSQEIPIGIRYAKGRADWNVTPAIRLFYSFQHDWNLSTGGQATSPFQNINWTNTSTIGLNINKARTTHSYRFGYVNFNNRVDSQELRVPFPRVNGLPYYLNVGTFLAGPSLGVPQSTFQNNYQDSYDGSLAHGRHVLRYGVAVTRVVMAAFAWSPLRVLGTFDASTIAQVRARGGNAQDPLEYPFERFITSPATGFYTVRPAQNLPHGGHFNTRTAWFSGDSIKAGRRLTLNLGLRWEYDTGYFANDRHVPRDPALETWIRGASNFPQMPKDLFWPSFGFAYDPTGSGKTVIRGGFYKAYEMNFYYLDEMAMLPPGISPTLYDQTSVTGPDGTPINVDGRHPNGNYSDLVGQPIRNVIGLIAQVHQALRTAYAGYPFDPARGPSQFTLTRGTGTTGIIPGNQFKIPYALQFNIGVQRELKPGTVLSADYVENRGVGLPFLAVDFGRRLDAATLNGAAAQAQLNRVLAGKTVDEWIATNPSRNISAFGLVNDAIWQGLTPGFLRATLMTGGFNRYRGLQVSLRGARRSLGIFKDASYLVSYALSRGEAVGAAGNEFGGGVADNRKWNREETFGPTVLDFTHNLSVASLLTTPGGFHLTSLWGFRTAGAMSLVVPSLGAAISGIQGVFGTDLNGDGSVSPGSPRPDVLPGLNIGQFGRQVKTFQELNRVLQSFNQALAGKLTPHGQALVDAGLFTEAQLRRLGAVIPTIPLVPEDNPNPWHNMLVTGLRLDRPVKFKRLREGAAVVPFVDIINLFNHAPAGLYGSGRTGLAGRFGALNFDYANAPPGQQASDLDAQRHRINDTRRIQIGVRLDF